MRRTRGQGSRLRGVECGGLDESIREARSSVRGSMMVALEKVTRRKGSVVGITLCVYPMGSYEFVCAQRMMLVVCFVPSALAMLVGNCEMYVFGGQQTLT